jgi:hypothetical protein
MHAPSTHKHPPLLFPLLLAAYPALTLYEWNIREIPAHTLWRPLFLSLGVALLLMLLIRWMIHDWVRSALLTSLVLLLFSSYGQVHHTLEEFPFYEHLVFRYWLLGLLWLILFVSATIFILKNQTSPKFLWILNAATAALVIVPISQILSHQLNPKIQAEFPAEWYPVTQAPETRPDIYYFILDGYARADYLEYKTNYDNTGFVDALSQRGFYVAPCSRTNYNNTILALTTTLNMHYYADLEGVAKAQGLSRTQIWRYLKPNITMQTLHSLGYQTMAFDSGYFWSSMDNADVYLQPWADTGDPPYMTNFEYLLLKSTPLVTLYERDGELTSTALDDLVFPYRYHVAQEEYILDQAPRIALIDRPTFTFIHVMIPHEPMVFSPEGIHTSTLYFGAASDWPTTPLAFQKAYVNGVKYLNPRMLEIVDKILRDSDTPPIIIIQGDHGFWSGVNLPILNAYYLPGDASRLLYPTISPVNSFRLIFNEYFGTNLALLEDTSFLVDNIDQPVTEEMEDCLNLKPVK